MKKYDFQEIHDFLIKNGLSVPRTPKAAYELAKANGFILTPVKKTNIFIRFFEDFSISHY